MSYEMIGESIKSATSIRLGEIFRVATGQVDQQGNPTYTYPIRYKENITNQRYPNFHIIQVNTNTTPQQTMVQSAMNYDHRRIQFDYLINVQYRVANDLETVTNLRQQLEAVGLKLLSEFNYITLEVPVWVKNSRYEIVDGVLQFFFNVTVFALMDSQNDEEMGEVEINETLNTSTNNNEEEE